MIFYYDLNLWGFTFIDKIENLRMDEIHDYLFDIEVNLKDVIFSSWKSNTDGCIWIVAADRYLDEFEIKDVIDFLIENEMEDNFLMGGNE